MKLDQLHHNATRITSLNLFTLSIGICTPETQREMNSVLEALGKVKSRSNTQETEACGERVSLVHILYVKCTLPSTGHFACVVLASSSGHVTWVLLFQFNSLSLHQARGFPLSCVDAFPSVLLLPSPKTETGHIDSSRKPDVPAGKILAV